jgi:Glycosyl hydrolase catalytic core
MKKCAYLVALLECVLLMPLGRAQTRDVVVGVNLLNHPEQLTPQEQDTILDNMKNAGVRVIRAGIINNDQYLDFIQRVYSHGIKIEGLSGVRGPAGNMILSVADPDKFRADFEPFLAKLESKGIVLAGIELGNEINWALWNHDLSGGTGRVLTLQDLSRDPEGRQVAKGYLQYIKVLAVLKDIRDHSKLNQHTPILSAGLAPWEPPSTGSKNDAVGLSATLQFLRANGMDKFVDAYGVHWYPPGGSATPAVRLSEMQRVFAECRSDKPCWLTEWGLPVSSGKSCPVVDDKRTAIFTELRKDFSLFAQQERLRGIIFYAWQGDIHEEGPYNAFLCGSLTKSGRLAIAPL